MDVERAEIPSFSKYTQEEALERWGSSAFIVCLDMPEGTLFGLDYVVFDVGKGFKGVKLVPTGVHFVYTASRNAKYGEESLRTGYFMELLEPHSFWIRRWNKHSEMLEPITQEKELESIKRNVQSMSWDQFLGPYPRDSYETWGALSKFIRIPQLRIEIPDRIVGVTGAQTTQKNFDKSEILEEWINQHWMGDWFRVLGEWQGAFVEFGLLYSADAFEYWKKLFCHLCQADTLRHNRPRFFYHFLETLEAQLRLAPSDMVEVTDDSFIGYHLCGLFEILFDDGNDFEIAPLPPPSFSPHGTLVSEKVDKDECDWFEELSIGENGKLEAIKRATHQHPPSSSSSHISPDGKMKMTQMKMDDAESDVIEVGEEVDGDIIQDLEKEKYERLLAEKTEEFVNFCNRLFRVDFRSWEDRSRFLGEDDQPVIVP
eukprot:TRINITY_DN32833_c0_g1_i1.p1 TRINITY_DN32833_c0_g1~~TRINITY_DN32833_c0_g1_i1.p1  ORF type:complete len:428 (+),score=113.73 TRINITY_DN32833_c0_g1_i1:72-1355(+)